MPLDANPDPTPRPGDAAEALTLLQDLARWVASPDAPALSATSAGFAGELLTAVERATPLGVSVHVRLDAVRKWLAVLAQPAEHGRFGGTERLRDHVLSQLRGAEAAVRDYFGAQP